MPHKLALDYALARETSHGSTLYLTQPIGGGQVRTLLSGFFVNQGMVAVRGAIGYGRDKGTVRDGVGGSEGLSAMDEARNVGQNVVQMLKRLHPTCQLR